MHLQLTHGIDVALVVLNAFFLFFLGLVVYLRREDRREGYPLEHELTGRLEGGGALSTAPTKFFKLPFGHGTVSAPTKGREPLNVPGARKSDWFPGAPIEPTGNPLVDGVGPAAWAERAKRPDLDWEGHARIVPLSAADGFFIARQDADPRGFTVLGCDGKVAGTIREVWIDKADRLIRYLEVEITGGRHVLAPMTMATIARARSTVTVDAVTAAQFADAPAIEGTGVITLYEEERVQAYFGGGYLYATAARSEPLI
ncbi:photosynthetic reaction center subunit H [Sphingomonas psychrolutea]|uniref:Photosynthetic reaction center subunit H n=1 Tax=Sphingomonas psychrolutea TaxID=1259676 RepID=A0ABQ1GLL6_9SPHN|nr:photosynthetic reaction center subunit H [Sphingomonas psychrolutea]GGA45940.1 photosynthetic reaction center subunit H [Sphingomonas psychrolutea]